MDILNIEGLQKRYKNHVEALKGIDLAVEEGGFFGLIGSNGAGKSTIIGILTGLVSKSAGRIFINGIDADLHPDTVRQYIGVVPQELNFNSFEKIENVLINQAGYYGISRRHSILKAEELLNHMGLWEKRNAEVRSLSGGMKRRLMLARALVHSPRLLLLDEPTVGIDVAMRKQTWDFLTRLNKEGTTIFLTSHHLDEVEQLCRTAAIIKEGTIIKRGSISELIASIDKQKYIVTLNRDPEPFEFPHFEWKQVDHKIYQATVKKSDDLAHLVSLISAHGLKIYDIRPKYNRLEQLYFNLNSTKNHEH